MPADRHERKAPNSRQAPWEQDRNAGEGESVDGLRIVRSLKRTERHAFSTRLQSAIHDDDHLKVKSLLADKVNIAYEPGAATPVHSCARSNRPKCCRVLLEFGFDPNHTDHRGRTPLAVAVGNDSKATAAIIEEFGGVLQARTNILAVQDTELDDLAGDMAGMMDARAVSSATLNSLTAGINGVRMDAPEKSEGIKTDGIEMDKGSVDGSRV